MKRDFLDVDDLSVQELRGVLDRAQAMKRTRARENVLEGKTVALIFEKPSLRTRSTLSVATYELGGYGLYLDHNIGLGSREPARDVARNLERWVAAIAARVYRHETLIELRDNARIPVINALSDRAHPLQAIADLMTLEEAFGRLEGLRVAWVGDGNNVLASFAKAAAMVGMEVVAAIPPGYDPPESLPLEIVRDPRAAVVGADAVYTDVWISMGQEAEAERRRADFAGFRVTPELFALAKPTAAFLHCLPAHYGEEVDEAVVNHPRSRVFDQAENRLHAAKAVLRFLLGEG